MSRRPQGVTLAAILTLLSSFALFSFFMINSIVLVVGGGHGEGFDWLYVMTSYPNLPISLLLTVYAFSLSISMLVLATRYVWYASIVFWLLLVLFFSLWGYNIWLVIGKAPWPLDLQLGAVIVTLLPFIYAIGCLSYFQKQKVKQHFHILARRMAESGSQQK